MDINKIKTEEALMEFEASYENMGRNETVRDLAYNIMEEYFCIKEEPVQHVDTDLLLSKINAAMVYTTRLDDMPFLMQSNDLEHISYKKSLETIESDSKPKYKPGTAVTRKRKKELTNYNAMSKRLKLLSENRHRILHENTKLLKLCNIVNVVVEKILNVEPNVPVNVKDFQIKNETEENQSSESITEVVDSADDEPVSETISLDDKPCQSSQKRIPSFQFNSSIERLLSKDNISKHNSACIIYFHDTYFNNWTLFGVDEIGIIKVYLQYYGQTNKLQILDIHECSVVHKFTRCCWYSLNQKIKKIWYKCFNVLKYESDSSDFILKPHRCRLDTCDCCCRPKVGTPMNNTCPPICDYESARDNNILKSRQHVTSEIRKYFLDAIYVKKSNATSGIINAQTPFIHLKNIETCQNELYYLNKNGNIGGYYINWYKCKTPAITKLINVALTSSYNATYLIVCCWAKREEAIAGLLKTKVKFTHPAISRYMKRFHACEPQNCKCCCKSMLNKGLIKPKITLKPLILPNIRNHTIQNRPIRGVNSKTDPPSITAKVPQNQSVNMQISDKLPTSTEIKKQKIHERVVVPSVTIPPSWNAVNNKTKNSPLIKHLPEEKQPSSTVVETSTVDTKPKPVTTSNTTIINPVYYINVPQSLPISMSNTILSVDANRKVAAALPSPVTEYSKEELHVLAVVLIKAQEQVNKLMLMPGTKLNIVKPVVPTLTVNNSTVTPIPQSCDTKSIQKKNMLKQFTTTAVLKSQKYKNSFYRGKNLQAMKIKESDPVINVNSVSTTEHKAKLEDAIVAGPSAIQVPLAIPSTSRGPPNYHTEIVHSSEPVAQLTPIINTTVVESSDDLSETEYDIQFNEIDEDIKSTLHDDITIEEQEIQDSDSESENDECILGT